MPSRPRRFPWIRLGLTFIVGSVLASFMRYYLALAGRAADIDSREQLPDTSRDLYDIFAREFLFVGSYPAVLFWLGILAVLVGAIRLMIGPVRGGAERTGGAGGVGGAGVSASVPRRPRDHEAPLRKPRV